MIGLDTNVLVRYITQDDEHQSLTVNAFFAQAVEDDETLFLDDIVLCELVWVLRAAYGYDRTTIAITLEKIFDTAIFAFRDLDLLRQGLADYRDRRGGFADYVIGLRNMASGCRHTLTFDRALKRADGFELL